MHLVQQLHEFRTLIGSEADSSISDLDDGYVLALRVPKKGKRSWGSYGPEEIRLGPPKIVGQIKVVDCLLVEWNLPLRFKHIEGQSARFNFLHGGKIEWAEHTVHAPGLGRPVDRTRAHLVRVEVGEGGGIPAI